MFFGALNRNLLVTRSKPVSFFVINKLLICNKQSFFAIKKIALRFLSIFESKVF